MQEIKGVYLEFDGIPFIIIGHKLLECQNVPENRALFGGINNYIKFDWIKMNSGPLVIQR